MPLQPTRYDERNPAASFTALEGSIQRTVRSIAEAMITLEPTDVKTTTYTARPRDLVLADPTDAAFEVLLPDPVPGGQPIMVKKISSSANAVTLRTFTSSVTIDGSATLALADAYDQALLVPVSATLWAVVSQPTAQAEDLEETLDAGNETGGHDIDITSGDAINFLGSIKIQDTGVDFITSDGTYVILDQGKLQVGTSSAPAVRIDRAFAATSAKVSLTAPSGATAGYDLIIEGGAGGPTGNQAGGDLRLRGGPRSNSGAYGDVQIEHNDGTVYLQTDVANTRVRIGTSINWGLTGSPVLEFTATYSSSSTCRVLKWDPVTYSPERILYVGDAGVSGTVTHIDGTKLVFAIDQVDRVFWQSAEAIFNQSYVLQWRDSFSTPHNVLTASLGDVTLSAKAGRTLTLTGATVVISGTFSAGAMTATSLALGTDPADAGTLMLPNAGTVTFEAAPAGTDVQAMTVTSGEILQLGNDTTAVDVHVRALTSVELYAGGALIAEAEAGQFQLQAAIKLDWLSGTAALSVGGTDFINYNGTTLALTGAVTASTLALSGAFLSIGADPADTGTIRLENAATIYFEASPAGTDVRALTVDASENVILGEDTNAVDVQLRAATSVELYAGAALIAEAEAGQLQLQASIKLDWLSGTAALSIGGTNWLSATTSLASFAQPISVTNGAVNLAGTGLIRTPNNISFRGRNVGNTADVVMVALSNADIVGLGDATNAVAVNIDANTLIRGIINATVVTITRSNQFEIGSTFALDFAGELKITRGDVDYITSTANVVNITTNAHLNIVKRQNLGGGAVATLGTIGGSGPTTAAAAGWAEFKSNGTTAWFQYWV